jgi:hypothetical protein
MNRAVTIIRRSAGALLLLAASLSLTACGGAAVGLLAGGGIGGTGFSNGVIVAFGSVVVNGVEFQTDDNTVRKRLDDGPDNIPGLDNEVFKVGMVVRVHHAADDNHAVQIDYQDDLEGPVASLDIGAGTFTVLGQPVAFDDATNLFVEGGAAFDDGATVEVSGLYDAAGLLHATFIQVEAKAKTIFEIKGFVGNLNSQAQTFGLGPALDAATVTVSYAGAELKDLPAGLANGLYVEVKTATSAGTLLATSVERKSSVADDVPAAGKASIEGFMANLSGSDPNFTFLLNGVTVTTNAATAGRANVALNARVEVEGTVSNGILSAETIEPR